VDNVFWVGLQATSATIFYLLLFNALAELQKDFRNVPLTAINRLRYGLGIERHHGDTAMNVYNIDRDDDAPAWQGPYEMTLNLEEVAISMPGSRRSILLSAVDLDVQYALDCEAGDITIDSISVWAWDAETSRFELTPLCRKAGAILWGQLAPVLMQHARKHGYGPRERRETTYRAIAGRVA
jgi:hypothetical protein